MMKLGWTRSQAPIPVLRMGSCVLTVAILILYGWSAMAATLVVDSTADAPDAMPGDGICATATATCTLRAAIQEANALPEEDSIQLPAGTYNLALTGPDEDLSATGDIDIVDDLTIEGATTGNSIISADGLDRVLDVHGPAVAMISRVTIQNGNVTGDGGGIRSSGMLSLQASTLRNNMAVSGDGGGIANLGGGTMELTNVTLSGNSAAMRGGGIANSTDATLQLVNVTLSENSATSGGAIHNFGTASVFNTLIDNGPMGGTCAGSEIVSLGHNLDRLGTCILNQAGDLNNVDPQLGPLQDNGGSILTQALQAESPAIDAGDNLGCPSTDERGAVRPVDGNNDGLATCDIGAFELQVSTPTPTITPISTQTPPAVTPTVTPTQSSPPTPMTATPEAPVIHLGSAEGSPGDTVSFSATLRTGSFSVALAQNDISFDGENVAIAMQDGGDPDCEIGPEINNKEQSFTFPCGELPCMIVRAIIYSRALPPFNPISDGSVLYTCRVKISADAPPGHYPLIISRIVVADLEGARIPDAAGTNGEIVVVPKPTATFTPAATATPTQPPTPVPTPACPGDCNGDGTVTIDEILTMVNIALGNAPIEACMAGDADGSSTITVNEIIIAVNGALTACP